MSTTSQPSSGQEATQWFLEALETELMDAVIIEARHISGLGIGAWSDLKAALDALDMWRAKNGGSGYG